ncbi:hypothetical protein ACP70R_040091 [Stipagrostis hirtigluma subsp. patula]
MDDADKYTLSFSQNDLPVGLLEAQYNTHQREGE